VAVPKILQAIANIQAGVGAIPKNGVGPASMGSYKYIKNDDILEVISKLLVQHNVIVQPKILKHELISREIGANRVVPMTVVELETTYVSVEDGSTFTVVTTAEGADNGDKGGRKAVTQAQKIANLLTFSIATGEPDPDGIDVAPVAGVSASPTAKKIANAKAGDAASIFNEIKAFLGANGLQGSVANALGTRLSGGKASSEWSSDTSVLTEILKALKNGEVE
ncbi:MAG: hypothetical protein EBU08_23870, partial [Micrococcales bacterium]|nr:hypothetical protein [Micrococcales bacterium]